MAKKLDAKINKYFNEDIDIYNPVILKEWVEKLENENPQTVEELEEFINKIDSLNLKINDIVADIYIKMTCHTDEKKHEEDYNTFQKNITSYYAPKDFNFKSIILNSPALNEWIKENGETAELFHKILKNDHDMFREKNVKLEIKESEIAIAYTSTIGGTTIHFNDLELTIPQIDAFMKDPNREVREKAWRAKNDKMIEHKSKLNDIFDNLYSVRVKMAKNAGFDNYRDYMHKLKGRFSYTVEDVYNFHSSVESEMLPLILKINEKRKEKLNVDKLRPWDMGVDLDGRVLRPVETPKDLIPKTISILNSTDELFGDNFSSMNETNLLDLFNRKNKAPGGYSYPLHKYGASFIFMNAVGLHSDLGTILHEAGHAMHEFAQADHKYTSFLSLPMEAAELASMSMEMITMDNWNICYTDNSDFEKAKYTQIEESLKFFPWCMTIDSFQHRIYTDANNSELREKVFLDTMSRFSDSIGVDWEGLEKEKKIKWLNQLHIFEIPFYYIEYGIAQLGALSVYRAYKKDSKKAIENYKNFLNTGHKAPLGSLYKAAGIELKFTKDYIKELIDFIAKDLGY